MATSSPLCTNCKLSPPNIGYKWCNACYSGSKPGFYHAKCLRCGHPPNPGYSLCEICFRNENSPGTRQCVMCYKSPADPSMDLCQVCWGLLNNTTGNQPMSYPGSPPAPTYYPPTLVPQPMRPFNLSTISRVLCTKCHVMGRNPGHPLCERCYQGEMNAMPQPNPAYLNGFTQPTMPFPPISYFPPVLPMNLISQYGFPSIDSSPVSQDKDAKTLLNMGSSYVNKKVMKEKPQPTDTTDYHCMCPLCYGDTSRTDLFYCVHCFDSVVVGNEICNACKMKVK